MASELSSALTMVMSSTSSGSWRSTLPTASRRSLAATLMSTESLNSTTTRLDAGAARGRDRLHARHARGGAFENVGNLPVDRLRRRALIGGADGDDGPVDVGQLADLDAAEGGEPGDDDQEIGDDRQAPGGGRRAPKSPWSPRRARPARPRTASPSRQLRVAGRPAPLTAGDACRGRTSASGAGSPRRWSGPRRPRSPLRLRGAAAALQLRRGRLPQSRPSRRRCRSVA